MKITKEVIEHVAGLARLNLTEAEHSSLTQDMKDIIGWVDKLNELDTTAVKPMEHVIPIQNVLREDICEPSFARDSILENAPDKSEGCLRVPKIVE